MKPEARVFAHLHHVYSPVCQVLRQVWVQHHVVLIWCVAVYVSTGRGDGAQLHNQRVLAPIGLKVAQRRAVATTAISILHGEEGGKCACSVSSSPHSISSKARVKNTGRFALWKHATER